MPKFLHVQGGTISLSEAQTKVLADLRDNGPVEIRAQMYCLPKRKDSTVHYGCSRVTASTFDSLERRGLIQWTVDKDTTGSLYRIYSATLVGNAGEIRG